MTPPVIKEIVVPCDAAKAFDLFVKQSMDWWPVGKHSVSAGEGKAAQGVTIEPIVGGAIYEIKHDGSRSDWGRVIAYDEGRYVSMTWHAGTDPATATKVEILFENVEDGKCKVSLTHNGWDIWAEKATDMRNGYDSGWVHVFEECFARSF